MAIVNIRRDLDEQLARDPKVTAARRKLAQRVSDLARERTSSSRVKGSHRVEVDESANPPVVAAAMGERHDPSFIAAFIEFGGSGFRPPPAPLRSAAKSLGVKVQEE